MTEEHIKEALSRGFIQLLANRTGFKCTKPELDNGVDLSITRSTVFIRDGRTRLLDSGEYVEVQLKSTTENSVIREDNLIKYDFEAKNYNDLIDRRDSVIPLYLILFVLPVEPNDWLYIDIEKLILKGTAYWYKPSITDVYTANVATVRITIPSDNQIGLTFVTERFEEVYG